MTDTRFSLQSLCDHSEWVAALARQLVADPGRADDVAQQTMLEALQRPPADWSNPRGWLATAARNVARSFARADARRSRREQVAARTEQVKDAATLVERARLHRGLVDEVLALDEPYRTVLLMRFFDDLPPRVIARRLARPVDTVRTQIARGLERIRRALDAEHGDRRQWCLALAPLLQQQKFIAGGSVLAIGGSMMLMKWVVPAAVIAVLVLGYGYALGESEPSAPAVEGLPLIAEPADLSGTVERQRLQALEVTEYAAVPSVPMYEAKLVDMQGRAMVGIEIESRAVTPWIDDQGRIRAGLATIDLENGEMRELLAAADVLEVLGKHLPNPAEVLRAVRGERIAPEVVRTDSEGRFAVRDPNAIPSRSEGMVRMTVYRQLKLPANLIIYGVAEEEGAEAERVLIAGPSVQVAGLVVDGAGLGIADAEVKIAFSVVSLPGYPQTLSRSGSSSTSISTSTDEYGAFELSQVPANSFLRVSASHPDYRRSGLPVPEVDQLDLRIALQRRPDDQRMIVSGVVLLQGGGPAISADVNFGPNSDRADAEGRFAFEVTSLSEDWDLIALTTGRQMAIIEGFGKRLRGDKMAGRDLQLVLGGAPLEIQGRLVDADDKPLRGMAVWLADATMLGNSWPGVEARISGQRKIESGPDGGFVIRGLHPRPYRIYAFDRDSLLVLKSGSVQAGSSDLIMRPPATPFVAEFCGQVVDRHGLPIADLAIVAALADDLDYSMTGYRPVEIARTDERGLFMVRNFPRQHVLLRIVGVERVRQTVVLPRLEGPSPQRIEVVRIFKFRLLPSPGTAADYFAVQDGEGGVMRVDIDRPFGSVMFFRAPLSMVEHSPVCQVDEGAARIVLYEGEKIVGEVPLDLRPDVINEIRF